MKFKIELLSLLICSGLFSSAQVSYGVTGGLQQINASVKIKSGPHVDVKPGYGFHIGTMLKVPFDKQVFFAPQLLYSLKGVTLNLNNALQDSVSRNRLVIHYIEIPAFLQFDAKADGNGLFFLFGPSVSAAISGSEKRTFLNGKESTRSMRFAYTAYGRFEMNLVAKVGYRLQNNWMITGGYSLGLGSIVNDDLAPRIRPRTITISAGYFFPGKLF